MGITLENCGILREDILEGVINQIADGLDEQIDRQIRYSIETLIDTRVQEMLEKKISGVVDQYLAREFTPVDQWGEPKGPSTSVQDMLARTLTDWWTTKVDREGRPNNYGSDTVRAQYFASKVAKDVLEDSLKNEYQKT